ncbi:class D beta-lactamase [Shewanella sp. AS16]|uniref:class D beta-lactamase n=1 Tax=Shewanella sp. AS16 TaxID=2907625 RepID=UPI003FA3A969
MRLLVILGLLCAGQVNAMDWQETRNWDAIFKQHKAKGVFVLWNETRAEGLTNDSKRANQGFIPASTFKIPNSLIALELGVVKDERQAFPWDKQVRDIASWNRDQTFVSAMKYSVVPVYQQIARDIGEPRMASMLTSLGYGNADIGGALDRFWLDGELRISALQQIDFLRRLYHNQLPLSERSQRIVKQMMLTEANADYIIRAKTGYGVSLKPAVGWWVGWVERDDNSYFFAINIDMASAEALPLRQRIAKEILAMEHVL